MCPGTTARGRLSSFHGPANKKQRLFGGSVVKPPKEGNVPLNNWENKTKRTYHLHQADSLSLSLTLPLRAEGLD